MGRATCALAVKTALILSCSPPPPSFTFIFSFSFPVDGSQLHLYTCVHISGLFHTSPLTLSISFCFFLSDIFFSLASCIFLNRDSIFVLNYIFLLTFVLSLFILPFLSYRALFFSIFSFACIGYGQSRQPYCVVGAGKMERRTLFTSIFVFRLVTVVVS